MQDRNGDLIEIGSRVVVEYQIPPTMAITNELLPDGTRGPNIVRREITTWDFSGVVERINADGTIKVRVVGQAAEPDRMQGDFYNVHPVCVIDRWLPISEWPDS